MKPICTTCWFCSFPLLDYLLWKPKAHSLSFSTIDDLIFFLFVECCLSFIKLCNLLVAILQITKRDVNRGLWLIIWNGGLSKASTLALLMHDQPNKLTTMVIISNSKHKQAKGSLHWNIEFILPFYLLSKWLRRSIIGVKLLLWVINSFCIYDYVFMISNINVLF